MTGSVILKVPLNWKNQNLFYVDSYRQNITDFEIKFDFFNLGLKNRASWGFLWVLVVQKESGASDTLRCTE